MEGMAGGAFVSQGTPLQQGLLGVRADSPSPAATPTHMVFRVGGQMGEHGG